MRESKEQKRCDKCGKEYDAALPACPACSGDQEERPHHTLVRNRYRLLSRGAAHWSGRAFLARDEDEQRDVVVELLSKRHQADEAFVDACEHKARILERLAHPGLARLHVFERTPGPVCFVWEHVAGRRLDLVLAD